jgi:hypothetical protein
VVNLFHSSVTRSGAVAFYVFVFLAIRDLQFVLVVCSGGMGFSCSRIFMPSTLTECWTKMEGILLWIHTHGGSRFSAKKLNVCFVRLVTRGSAIFRLCFFELVSVI